MKRIAPLPASVNLQPLPGRMAAFGIAGSSPCGGGLFMTHPPLSERIAALEVAGQRGWS